MKLPLLLAFFTLCLFTQVLPFDGNTVHVASGDLSIDLNGSACPPPAWGNCQSVTWPLTFTPPAGFATRILKLQGDVIAYPWPNQLGSYPPVSADLSTGFLVGFQTSAPEGSINCNFCADNTPMYIQNAIVGMSRLNRSFEYSYPTPYLLPPDNALTVKAASFLNLMGRPIHLEITYTVTFEFTRIP